MTALQQHGDIQLRRDIAELTEVRATNPAAIAAAAGRRRHIDRLPEDGRLLLLAADHPARGVLAVGKDPLAMADRTDLLCRLVTALERPGVDGVVGTADILEDLLLLGALDDKFVAGSMNRGGLRGAAFEVDDRFTGYDAERIAAHHFDAGKMLLRINLNDRSTVATMEACAQAVNELAERKLTAIVEPFVSRWVPDGIGDRLEVDTDPVSLRVAISIASGLGATSAYTWLKVPLADDPDVTRAVMASSTLPALVLGGDVRGDTASTYQRWADALTLPTVRGLVIGRALLYPPDDDVLKAVDTAARLVHE